MFGVAYLIDQGTLPEIAILIGLFGPAMVAVIFSVKDGGNKQATSLLKQYVKGRVHISNYLVALLVIPSTIYITMLITDISGLVTYEHWFRAVGIPQLIFIPLISIGEELGWRGYLQPLLRKQYSLLVARKV